MKRYVCLLLLLCTVSVAACMGPAQNVQEKGVQPESVAEANQEEPSKEEQQKEAEEKPVNSMMDLFADGTEEEQAYAEFVDELRFEKDFYEMLLEYWLPVTQYALVDINQDGVQELALATVGIEYPEEEPLRNYFIYGYDKETKEIHLIRMQILYQGTFQYSPNYQALVFRGEMFFDLPEGVESFYELQQMGGMGEGVKPLYEFLTMEKLGENRYRSFTVGSEDTASATLHYSEGTEKKEISEEEYEGYLEDAADIPLLDIPVPPSRELSRYLGQKLDVLLDETGEELLEGENEGEWKRLENDMLAVLIDPDTTMIQMVEMHMGSGYTVEGLRLVPNLMRAEVGADYLLRQTGWEAGAYGGEDTEYVNSAGQRLVLHFQELEGEEYWLGMPELESIRLYAGETAGEEKPEE